MEIDTVERSSRTQPVTVPVDDAESLGMDRWIKVNTAKKRTHSLFRQGQEYYMLIPNMKEEDLVRLIERFGQLVAEQPICREAFGIL